MNNKVLAAILGGVALLCVTILGVALIVTGGDESAPAPVATATPTPSDTSDPILDILEDTWNQTATSEQEKLCWFFNTDPQAAFNAFNEGSEGLVPQDTFNDFFSGECASIT